MERSEREFTYSMPEFLAFRDREVCGRVRKIDKNEVCIHPNDNFRMKVISDPDELSLAYALDIVKTIIEFRDSGEQLVLILPARVPAAAARLINQLDVTCEHVHTFNMDEYADEDGNTAPISWPGSFQKLMWDTFFGRIRPELRMPENQIHFPSGDNINDYATIIEDAGGTDVCFAQFGWNGHIAFWEPELGATIGEDLEKFKAAGPCMVDISPITVVQNSVLISHCGDWSWHPPRAATIGPAQVAGAKRNSWWLSGDFGRGVSWQRFIFRLVAHGPVTPRVPASILQILNTELTVLESVTENCDSPV